MATCVCITDSFCCTPETITTLLIHSNIKKLKDKSTTKIIIKTEKSISSQNWGQFLEVLAICRDEFRCHNLGDTPSGVETGDAA